MEDKQKLQNKGTKKKKNPHTTDYRAYKVIFTADGILQI